MRHLVVSEVVHVDGRHAFVEIARHGHGEEIAHPDRHEDLQLQPPPSALRLPAIGDESQPLLRNLAHSERHVLTRHPGDDDKGRQRAKHAAAACLRQARKGEEIVDGPASEAASVGAAASQDAAPAAGLPGLDPSGVSGPGKVDVRLALAAVVVEARDVGAYAIERRHLERGSRRGQAHRHGFHPVPVTLEHPLHERHAA